MAVINDKQNAANGSYEAGVINSTNYYAFGGLMPGRSFTLSEANAYRYGFNGKENDNEVKGAGNQQDYGMRIYDPRIGKFLSVDPITYQYPELTPYQFASNTPIWALDVDGLEGGIANIMGGGNVIDAATAKTIVTNNWFQEPASFWMRQGLAFQMNAIQPVPVYNSNSYPGMTKGQYIAASMSQSLINHNHTSQQFSSGARTRLPQQPHVEVEAEVTLPKLRVVKESDVGDLREAYVAQVTRGQIAKVDGKDIVVRSRDGKLGATVDVISEKGDFITVGGANKAGKKEGKFLSTVSSLKKIANERGVKAQAYMADNTPDALISKLEKVLGKENVFKIKDKKD
ncbi:RHS repeat-associated core domain-containing protein [Pedobacter miscanthi]|uniref:RHS repeat domain-containing protein n=1 Tax=Pedobacter miscanthi TaxID=2259170 RepID=UPI00292D85D1|nr:RHS repeat-associated core domain-containing protein [Pedobacter miscanthi]